MFTPNIALKCLMLSWQAVKYSPRISPDFSDQTFQIAIQKSPQNFKNFCRHDNPRAYVDDVRYKGSSRTSLADGQNRQKGRTTEKGKAGTEVSRHIVA